LAIRSGGFDHIFWQLRAVRFSNVQNSRQRSRNLKTVAAFGRQDRSKTGPFTEGMKISPVFLPLILSPDSIGSSITAVTLFERLIPLF
jgi:hypothetical protein